MISGLDAVRYINDPIMDLYKLGSTSLQTEKEDISLESSSGPRLITKGDFSQKETPSLGNAFNLSNRFEDAFGVEADLSNMETNIPEEPKQIFDALKDPSWVLKNKKVERGIVIRNKARLVSQGYTQEKGIDYEEVSTPVARIEAIRLLLAYASFMGFIVYQMDVKSAFLYGTIDEEVYVMQPPGFQDPEFQDRVYKVEKAMYGLHQAPRAWYGTKDVASQAVKKDFPSLRYIALLNWFHEAYMETYNDTIRNSDAQDDSQKEQDCNADVPESSGISSPIATSKVSSAKQVEPAVSLTVESKIPTISSPVPTVFLDISLESSSGPRLITKGDFSQKETPSLGNAFNLSNRFEDAFGVEADLSNMETNIPVSPTPTFRIHKDHLKSQKLVQLILLFKPDTSLRRWKNKVSLL
nr:retrovirus-related Pol polyprotein from transposon TNT 1-94 [Tanacetum cinerariifolium]